MRRRESESQPDDLMMAAFAEDLMLVALAVWCVVALQAAIAGGSYRVEQARDAAAPRQECPAPPAPGFSVPVSAQPSSLFVIDFDRDGEILNVWWLTPLRLV